jgi:hypothetical protein
MARKKVVVPKEKEYICLIHDDITYKLEDIQEFDFSQTLISEIPELQKRMVESLQVIIDRVADAKERGIAMETRLYEYSNAIGGLGFTRDKDN